MQKVNYYIEGTKISFKIMQHVELAKNESYFVIKDKNEKKYLLKSDLYKKYNFNIGDIICCKIDHINCAGKIFLEPEHPFYKEGEVYSFKINKITNTKNRLGKIVLLLNFIDKLGNIASCIIEDIDKHKFQIGENIKCKVELIKKSKLYLSYYNENKPNRVESGKQYNFTIKDIKTLSDNFKYYILEDEFNQTHILRFEYYKHYNLKIGETCICKVLKFSSENYFILEPKHPFYEIGNEYYFKFIKQSKSLTFNHTEDYEITVKDIFDKETIFISNKKIYNKNTFNKIKCKVIGIKKGKTILSICS